MLRAFLLALLCATAANAGGGPETTLVVVNGRSPVSRRVAHDYVALRRVPANHVLYLDEVPHDGVIQLAEFREKIWAPIEAYLKRAGLDGAIDLITYSADFPYAVSFRKEMGGERPSQMIGGQAALTGVTYLIRQVEAGEPFWELLRGQNPTHTNRYSRFPWGGRVAGERKLTSDDREIFRKAAMAYRKQDYATAEREYAKFVKQAPQVGRAWIEYAACLVALKRNGDALDALESAARNGFADVRLVDSQQAFAPLRKDPRFTRLLERMRGSMPGLRPTRGFRAAHAWGADGEPGDDEKHRYFLSTQLAYTGFVGNSYPEVTAYLKASAGADSTMPDGTVYICKNSNVRSTARQQFFGALEGALKARGRKVEVLDNTKIPAGKDDVIGAVVGTAGFNWGASKSRILPGAICEHLTSFGAHFGTASQTKVSEFLRFGAAGSSGTVMEPLALHIKFPNPLIHVFYADGCTLAEAFYQSVHGPYQLMVIGDGLCQPFAKRAEFRVEGAGAPWKGKVAFQPEGAAGSYELWVDGRRVATGEPLEWDTTGELDGWHDVRIVHLSNDLLEMRTSQALDGVVANGSHALEASADPVVYGNPIQLKVKGAKQFEVWCGGRKVADGPSVDSRLVGPGPVDLIVRTETAQSRPVRVDVAPPLPLPASPRAGESALGLAGIADGKTPLVVTSLATRTAGVRMQDQLGAHKKAKTIQLMGGIEVAADGWYQLNVTGGGSVTIRIDGAEVCKDAALDRQAYVPVSLLKGWHALEIEYTARGLAQLEVLVTGDQRAAAPRIGRLLPDVDSPSIKVLDKGVLELTWKKTPKKGIEALGVIPEKGASLPTGWTVEWRRGKFGKFKKLDATVVVAPADKKAPRPKKGQKAKKPGPLAVELLFKRIKGKQVRLIPKSPVKVARVVVTR